MKIVFIIVFAAFLAVLVGIVLLTSAINKLRFQIAREASLEKRRAFQQRKRHFDQPLDPKNAPQASAPARVPAAPAAPAPRPVDDGGVPVDFSDAPDLRTRRTRIPDPLPPTTSIDSPTAKSPVSTPSDSFSRSISAPLSIGRVHNVGSRPSQQDAQCAVPLFQRLAVLAVVADGMGGMEDGGAVSQMIIEHVSGLARSIRPEHMDSALSSLLHIINREVTTSLGPERLFKCGSTFAAVLATQRVFHWISVGDTRIYLYRAGYLNQLNRDHNLLNEWMPDILDGTRDYAQCAEDPAGEQLTSFIGMGDLNEVDKNVRGIPVQPGDRILLLTDGVYKSVSPQQIAAILKQCPNVQAAAEMLERTVLAAQVSNQDNFTAQIIAF